MSKLLDKTTHSVNVIKNNDTIFLPTESAYILAHKDYQHLKQRAQLYSLPTFLFHSPEQVINYSQNLPWHAHHLLSILPPGNVEFILPHNQNLINIPKLQVFIPQHRATLELLSQFTNPIAGIYPQIGLNGLITHHKHILEHPEYNDTYTLVSETSLNGILPTLLDLTDPRKVVIKRPGVIGYKELTSILQNRVQVLKDYQPMKLFRDDWLKIEMTQSLPDSAGQGLNIVFGSKEILSHMFRIPMTEYFHHKKIGNFILKNIGSHTSQETVARNLTRHTLDLYKLGVQKVYIMQENWGASKWSEIINYYLEGVAESVHQSQPQGVKIPVRVRPILSSQDFVLS
jgi:tRNA A37 threonylcarbamoyladenosine synthetase subunit TsaC/SUA5/YrdC